MTWVWAETFHSDESTDYEGRYECDAWLDEVPGKKAIVRCRDTTDGGEVVFVYGTGVVRG